MTPLVRRTESRARQLARRAASACALLILVTAGGAAPAVASSPEARLLAQAMKLLPRRPTVEVRFIDPDLAPDPEAIRRLDAFLVRERDGRLRPVIYLNRSSEVVENALRGKDIHVAILAAVIQHEVEHLQGSGEPEARRAEREFFRTLLFGGRVPMQEGLAYLARLDAHYQLREAH